ncbi:LacI family DNA-binding transcriptional regulator [uncultured Pseudokineococcus sp.]|uniref:LacI family DNA-binding transcriptional regulator n=1 Tax=uncultured Pseudokineococcus sp. TaxID=1642928 RepID=UPI00261DE3DA|nr:LacI family DNA-binding transcriptional regulator [uncultured Pseudokineococcus sp.]
MVVVPPTGVPERSRATVYDVAERAGVSIATVSRVLRRPEAVSRATTQRVLDAVRELGYVPSGSARGLAARRSGAVGLVFPDFDDVEEIDPVCLSDEPVTVRPDPPGGAEPVTNLYMGEVMRGVEIEAWRHSLSVTVAVARGARKEAVLDDLAGRVDGLVVLGGTVPADVLARIGRSTPVVVVAGHRDGDDHDHVGTANGPGMRVLTEHLLHAHGLRDLAFAGGAADVSDDRDRFDGFRAALRAAGLPAPEAPLLRGDFTQARGRDLARRLVDAGDLPEALVCANDQTALGVLDVLLGAGVRVPQDLVLTGFDGIDAAGRSRPRLTTVHQPMVELGRVAVDALLQRLAGPGAPPTTRVLPVQVLLRESCGCGRA